MPIPHERYRAIPRQQPERAAQKPLSHYGEMIKRDIAKKPLQVGVPPREMLQRTQIAPGEVGTAFATDGTVADAMDARFIVFDTAFYERTGGERAIYKTDEVAQGMNRIIIAYDALTHDHRSPQARYQMQHRGYSPAEVARDPHAEITPDTLRLQPEESAFLTWALNTVGIAHQLQPGVNELNMKPFMEKLVKPDAERDQYAATRAPQLESGTIPFDIVQGVRLRPGEVEAMAEDETAHRRVIRALSMQYERQRKQQLEELLGIAAA